MNTKQWNTLLNESIAACDMSDVLQQTESWFNQGFDYWRAWSTFATSYAAPQKWLETAGGVSKTMENYVHDWARIYGLDPKASHGEELAAQKDQLQESNVAMEKIKKHKAALKRSLTQKEKTLKTQRAEVVQHRNRQKDNEKEIKTLQAKVKAQAERLIILEAANKKESQPAPQPKKGATVPPAGK